MAADALAGVPLANGDHAPAHAGLNEVAAQELRQSLQRRLTNIALQLANAMRREVADHATMAVEGLLAVVEQPVQDEWGNTALLCTEMGVSGLMSVNNGHVFS